MIANRVPSSHFMTLVSTEIHHMKIKTIIVKNIGHYKILMRELSCILIFDPQEHVVHSDQIRQTNQLALQCYFKR